MSSIGAKQRRARKAQTGLDVVESVPAQQAVESLAGHKADKLGADGLIGPEHEFELEHVDQRGRAWRGHFKCHILSIRERSQVGLTRSHMAAGMVPTGLDASTIDLLEMQAHLAVALDSAPEWANDLGGLHDITVLAAIYKEVASHEARFWGSNDNTDSEVAVE